MPSATISNINSVFPLTRRTYLWIAVIALAGAVVQFSYWDHFFHFLRVSSISATVAGGLWLALLLISATHVWQGVRGSVFGATTVIVGGSATLSGFWLFVFYPGTMSFDAISMWLQAVQDGYTAWLPPATAMLMHITQQFVPDVSLFCFLEGWLFWGSLFYLVRQVVADNRKFLIDCAVLTLIPPLWLYSSAATSNTWTAGFVALSAAFLVRSIREQDRRVLILAVASVAAATVFRRESAIVSVVVIAAYLWSFGDRRRWWIDAGVVALVLIGVRVPAMLIEASPRVKKNDSNPAGQGLLNQYVGTVVYSKSSMSEAELDRERESIDSAYGQGTFDELLERYTCYSSNYIVWNNKGGTGGPAVLKSKSLIRTRFAVQKIARTALRHPIGFLEHELCYVGHLSQFADVYYDDWGMLNRSRMPRMRKKLGMPFDSHLPAVYDAQRAVMESVLDDAIPRLLLRHYLFLLGIILALVVGIRRRSAELIVPAMFALTYPLAFVVAGPSTPWRYLLPTYVIAWILLLALAGDVVARMWRRTRPSALGPE